MSDGISRRPLSAACAAVQRLLAVLEDLEVVVGAAAQHELRHRPVDGQDLVVVPAHVVQGSARTEEKRGNGEQPSISVFVLGHYAHSNNASALNTSTPRNCDGDPTSTCGGVGGGEGERFIFDKSVCTGNPRQPHKECERRRD